MNLSTLDMLILIPFLPLGLVALTWWLPWEKVLDSAWDELPKFVVALYFLYAAFVAFYFKWGWWIKFVLASIGIVFLFGAIREAVKGTKHG
jgi:hypothetical protein